MSSTPLTDLVVASTRSRVVVGDRLAVEAKLAQISGGGPSKLQVIVDFDNTLTRSHKDGVPTDCSWGVMENSSLLPAGYTVETNALRAKYLPIETDPNMTVEEKTPHMVEWYTQANRLLQSTSITKEMFGDMVKTSNVELRDRTTVMMSGLSAASVPVLVMSAGLGDILVEIMDEFGVYHRNNTKVVSNFLDFGTDGRVVGLAGDIIHVYNKNENAIHDSDYFSSLKGRSNVLLLGDSLGDLRMADGVDAADSVVLKIGFLNDHNVPANVEKRLPAYESGYDIVLVDDQTMDVPMAILESIKGISFAAK